jgi:hypothetical protein
MSALTSGNNLSLWSQNQASGGGQLTLARKRLHKGPEQGCEWDGRWAGNGTDKCQAHVPEDIDVVVVSGPWQGRPESNPNLKSSPATGSKVSLA